MDLVLIRHLWGVTEPWEAAFPRLKAGGYSGIEAPIPVDSDRGRLVYLLEAHGLSYLPMIFTRGDTIEQNVESFRRQIEDAMSFAPTVINCHSGKDSWSEADSLHFYEQALKVEAQLRAPVAHETHRKRSFFNPWITSRIIERLPDLRVCCDFSHWVCVCERLLEDCEAFIQRAARHALHIHARVGYAEGPQVPDPRAPEWAVELTAHERWWDIVWDAQAARGMKTSTLTPEFGPPPYLHTLPHTNVPVADLTDVCDWQAKRQAQRFAARAAHPTR